MQVSPAHRSGTLLDPGGAAPPGSLAAAASALHTGSDEADAEGTGDALYAILAAVRAAARAGGGAILRADGDRLVPVAAQELDIEERPMDEASLLATDRGGCVSSYPLVSPGHVEGILLLDGAEGEASTATSPVLAPLLDLAAATLHHSRLIEEERTRSAAAVAESEARYRAVVEQSADGIMITQGNTFVFANHAAATFMGLADSSQLVGRPLDTFLAPGDEEGGLHPARSWQTAESTGGRREVRIRGADGVLRTGEIVTSPVVHDGRPASLATVRDVTERREADQHLRRLNEWFRLLLDIATLLATTLEPDVLLTTLLQRLVDVLPDADMGTIYLYDATTGCLLPRACAGLDPDVFTLTQLRPGESIEGVVYQTGQAQRVDTPKGLAAIMHSLSPSVRALATHDSRLRLLRSILTAPLRTADGTVVGTLSIGSMSAGFGTDDLPLLEGVATQAAMALHNAQLFAQARHDARNLKAALVEVQRAQDQMIQQERLRALGEMAAGIAHDFNNALAPVVGFSDLLLASPANLKDLVKARHYLEMINTGAQDAAAVVGRLREFYRPRNADDIREAIDVAAVVRQVVEFTKPRWHNEALAESRTIRIETALESVPSTAGRPSELREVLINLVFNAVDAMPDGGTITLACRLDAGHEDDGHAAGGPRVVLSVRDTGAGMPEEVRCRCLEPFFTTKGAAGTGLGLSTVCGTVRRWGGDVAIESAPGQGTTITISLPVYDSSTPHAAAAPAASIPPLRVLVVDDEPLVLAVTVACLRTDGHTVTPATTGHAALGELRDGHFDLVVIDRAMPDMSGDQLALTIKEFAPGLPVIMLTGFGLLMRAAHEQPIGVDAVVAKPVTLASLRQALALALSRGLSHQRRRS